MSKRASLSHLLDHLPLPSIRSRGGYHWFVVITVCIGAFMAALDASIINIALPTLQRHFHVAMNTVEWISLVYLLTLAAFIVPLGRLADIIGRRWMYAFGFLVFIFSSFFCGIADNLTFLLVFRAFQAIGAAMLQANSISIITNITPASDRGKAIGIQASAQGIGLSLGPALGGALITSFNWRWLFFINIPIGIIGTLLGILWLPKDQKTAKHENFDLLGAIFLTPAIISLVYLLNTGMNQGWTSPLILISYVITIVGFTLFVITEKKAKFPMVDFSLFKNAIFALGNVTGVMSFSVMYAVLLLVPFYLEHVHHYLPITSGLYLTVIPIGMTIFTPISGMIADRWGRRIPAMIGMLAAALGNILLSLTSVHIHTIYLIAGLFFIGAGLGIFTPPNNSSVMGSVPNHRLGVAGGILNMSRTLGMGLGVTLGGLTYEIMLSIQQAASMPHSPIMQMIISFHWSFLIIAFIAILAMLISAGRKKEEERG